MILKFLSAETAAARTSPTKTCLRRTAKNAVWQVNGGGAATWQLDFYGRLSDDFAWVAIGSTLTQASGASALLFETTQYPQMKCELTNQTVPVSGVSVSCEVDSATPGF